MRLCVFVCSWLKKRSGTSCLMESTPQLKHVPTRTSPRPTRSLCPNRTEPRPRLNPPNQEPTWDTSANQRSNPYRYRKQYTWIHQHGSFLMKQINKNIFPMHFSHLSHFYHLLIYLLPHTPLRAAPSSSLIPVYVCVLSVQHTTAVLSCERVLVNCIWL